MQLRSFQNFLLIILLSASNVTNLYAHETPITSLASCQAAVEAASNQSWAQACTNIKVYEVSTQIRHRFNDYAPSCNLTATCQGSPDPTTLKIAIWIKEGTSYSEICPLPLNIYIEKGELKCKK